ncbi:MAG: hypothetical protein DHS20C19_18760 [Acidimicrobiales bacterium]|nr:MAG: hypothetical protein DHS20C19_18760 [Acidimicrobiales bacterium]
MNDLTKLILAPTAALAFALAGCSEQGADDGHDHDHAGHSHADDGDDHDHAEGDDHAHDEGHDDDHDHERVSLGTATLGDTELAAWQSHGQAEAGKELHLIVKPNDASDGATTVRAWIGTEDRLTAMVALGEYDADTGEYNLHATCPNPLSDDAQWWIEMQTPNGVRTIVSMDLH